MNESQMVEKFECFEQLKAKILDADHGKGSKVGPFQEIVQGRTQSFKDHAVVAVKIEGVVENDVMRASTASASIEVLNNFGLDESRLVVSLDAADHFNGDVLGAFR